MVQELIEGFCEFKREEYEGKIDRMRQLVRDGQKPNCFIICCIDSRSNPALIFHSRPGKFFSHKAMGTIVRPYQKGTALSAALQFAIEIQRVDQLIILGHTHCGAIQALAEDIDDEEIASFVEVAKSGLERAKAITSKYAASKEDNESLLRCAEQQITLMSADNVRTYPSVQKALAEDRLDIRCWIFDMERGDLLEYQNDEQEFVILTT